VCVCECSSGATRRRRSARRWNAPPHEPPTTPTDGRRHRRRRRRRRRRIRRLRRLRRWLRLRWLRRRKPRSAVGWRLLGEPDDRYAANFGGLCNTICKNWFFFFLPSHTPQTHSYTHLHTTHTHAYTYLHTLTHIYIHKHTYTHTQTPTHIHIYNNIIYPSVAAAVCYNILRVSPAFSSSSSVSRGVGVTHFWFRVILQKSIIELSVAYDSPTEFIKNSFHLFFGLILIFNFLNIIFTTLLGHCISQPDRQQMESTEPDRRSCSAVAASRHHWHAHRR